MKREHFFFQGGNLTLIPSLITNFSLSFPHTLENKLSSRFNYSIYLIPGSKRMILNVVIYGFAEFIPRCWILKDKDLHDLHAQFWMQLQIDDYCGITHKIESSDKIHRITEHWSLILMDLFHTGMKIEALQPWCLETGMVVSC